jgi:hypothetical protein
MTERHYNDEEVAEIFRAATEGSTSRALPDGHADGLTLRDLQAIASEVGISPAAVSQAAMALDRPATSAVPQTFLGFPVAVERTVALNRRLTDTEWELLVVQLRETFRARGTVRSEGSLREWSNGNLHALLEPTATGYQLRLGTFKGNAQTSVAVGAMMLGLSALSGVFAGAHGTLSRAAPSMVVLATLGVGFIANGTLRLRSWARLRRQQIDGIVERLRATQDDQAVSPNHLDDEEPR